MKGTPYFIYAIALIFFAFSQTKTPFKIVPKTNYQFILQGIPQDQNKGSALWRALIMGDERGFTKKEKTTYYQLGLGHLFTPSGVHLATLSPILRLLPKLSWIYFMLGLGALFINGMAALARVGFVKAIPKQQFNFFSFMIVMILEGQIISWYDNRLSWTCSWLFLGLTWFAPKATRFWWFILAQLTLCWVLIKPFSLFVPLANLLVSIPLLIIFPLSLILSPIPKFWLHTLMITALEKLNWLVMKMDSWHQLIPPLSPHAGHIILILAWICLLGMNRIRYLPLIILFLSSPLNIYKPSSPSQSKWEYSPTTNAYALNGVIYSEGWKCRYKWKNARWENICRPSKRGGKRN